MDLKSLRLSEYDYEFNDRSHYKQPWNPYNKRRQILKAWPLKSHSAGSHGISKAQAQVIQRTQSGFITHTSKSLDLIRQLVQSKINKEIDAIIQKYLEKFFKPGIQNICQNNGSDSVTNDHINQICCQILEDAKQLYQGGCNFNIIGENPGPVDINDVWRPQKPGLWRKRKDTGSDSEKNYCASRKRIRSTTPEQPGTVSRPLMRFDISKWNPERIHKDTLFIMGSRANKVLGYGQMRGRVYNRHPELIKYLCDQEDKEWLFKQHHLWSTGSKVYIMLLEDVTDIVKREECRSNLGMYLDDLQGFLVPDFLINKVRLSLSMVSNELRSITDLSNIDEESSDSTLSTKEEKCMINQDYIRKYTAIKDKSQLSDTVALQEFPNMRFSSDETESPKHMKANIFPNLSLDDRSDSISVTLSSGQNILRAGSPSTADINAILETELDFEDSKVT